MSEELKPCPFCGGEAKNGRVADGWQVYCPSCRASGAPFYWGSEANAKAVTAWNARPSSAGEKPGTEDVAERLAKLSCHLETKLANAWYRGDDIVFDFETVKRINFEVERAFDRIEELEKRERELTEALSEIAPEAIANRARALKSL